MFNAASWAKITTSLNFLPTKFCPLASVSPPGQVGSSGNLSVCLPILPDQLGSFLYASLVALTTANLGLLPILVLSPLPYDLTLLEDRVLFLILFPVVSRAL